MTVSFIDGGNQSTRRKQSTCSKSQTLAHNFFYRLHLAMNKFELTTLVMIGIGHIGSWSTFSKWSWIIAFV